MPNFEKLTFALPRFYGFAQRMKERAALDLDKLLNACFPAKRLGRVCVFARKRAGNLFNALATSDQTSGNFAVTLG